MNSSTELTIADLEQRARDYETKAGECREAIAVLRKVFGLTAIDSTTPAASTDTTAAPARRKRRAVEPPPEADITDEVEYKVLKFLTGQKAPVRVATITKTLRYTKPSLRRALDALVEGGHVVRIGQTAAMRVGIPAVMQAAAAAKEEL